MKNQMTVSDKISVILTVFFYLFGIITWILRLSNHNSLLYYISFSLFLFIPVCFIIYDYIKIKNKKEIFPESIMFQVKYSFFLFTLLYSICLTSGNEQLIQKKFILILLAFIFCNICILVKYIMIKNKPLD